MVDLHLKSFSLEVSCGEFTITYPDYEITEDDYSDLVDAVNLFLKRINRKIKRNTNPKKLPGLKTVPKFPPKPPRARRD